MNVDTWDAEKVSSGGLVDILSNGDFYGVLDFAFKVSYLLTVDTLSVAQMHNA